MMALLQSLITGTRSMPSCMCPYCILRCSRRPPNSAIFRVKIQGLQCKKLLPISRNSLFDVYSPNSPQISYSSTKKQFSIFIALELSRSFFFSIASQVIYIYNFWLFSLSLYSNQERLPVAIVKFLLALGDERHGILFHVMECHFLP